jgi:hypothetical protein
MTNLHFLQMMYQQWCNGQGGDEIMNRWADFIDFAAKQTGTQQDEVMRALQKTYWFQWRREE